MAPAKTPRKHRAITRLWRKQMATKSFSVNDRGRLALLTEFGFIVSPQNFPKRSFLRRSFLERSTQVRPQTGIGNKTRDLGYCVFRYKHHVARMKKGILVQHTRFFHLLHIDDFGFRPLVVHPAE